MSSASREPLVEMLKKLRSVFSSSDIRESLCRSILYNVVRFLEMFRSVSVDGTRFGLETIEAALLLP